MNSCKIKKIPVYIHSSITDTINNIENKNWNRRLNRQNLSAIYELVNLWHKKIR